MKRIRDPSLGKLKNYVKSIFKWPRKIEHRIPQRYKKKGSLRTFSIEKDFFFWEIEFEFNIPPVQSTAKE